MKKFFVIALALALTAGAAYANYCARDYVPAATLLVPYAVVDMNGNVTDPNGYSTLLTVTNVSSERQLIHITVWNAISEPVVDFDEILSGYDVWSINFRDMLDGHFDYFDTEGVNGFWSSSNPAKPVEPYGPMTNLPYSTTMPAPVDTDSPTDLDAAVGCYFPYGYHPEYGAGIIAGLRAGIFAVDLQFTCTSYFVNNVPWQILLTDDPLFFYVTVDAVDACSLNFPNSDAYWANGNIPDEDNVLLGEVYYINWALNLSEAFPAVHLEYDPDAPDTGQATFYELATGANLSYIYDGLEPLATAFAFRYYNSNGVSSNLMLWKSHWEFMTFGSPYIYPYADACGIYVYYAWDENEKSKSRGRGPSGFDIPEPNVIPFETQKVPLTVANWTGLMANNGWMLLVFNPSVYDAPFWWSTEAWAGVQHNFGGFSAGLEAATMANYWCFPAQRMGTGSPFYLGVNFNYTDGDVPYYW
jgi:hypothetical protein